MIEMQVDSEAHSACLFDGLAFEVAKLKQEQPRNEQWPLEVCALRLAPPATHQKV
jgi:hypothetical protein